MTEPLVLVTERQLRTLIESAVDRSVQSALSRPAARPHPDPKAWLTNSEAQKYLGLSKPTLARYRKDGKLPYSKVGGNVYYRVADIEALLEASTR